MATIETQMYVHICERDTAETQGDCNFQEDDFIGLKEHKSSGVLLSKRSRESSLLQTLSSDTLQRLCILIKLL